MYRLKEFKEIRHINEILIEGEDKLENGVIYIDDSSPYIEFLCPCGCGRVTMIPINRNYEHVQHPYWDISESNDGAVISLSPSIYSTGFDCKSHYFIKENKIVWC